MKIESTWQCVNLRAKATLPFRREHTWLCFFVVRLLIHFMIKRDGEITDTVTVSSST